MRSTYCIPVGTVTRRCAVRVEEGGKGGSGSSWLGQRSVDCLCPAQRGARGAEPEGLTYLSTWCNPARNIPNPLAMSSQKDRNETVTKFDGMAGHTFDVYEDAILNVAAGRTDERGWSLAASTAGRRRLRMRACVRWQQLGKEPADNIGWGPAAKRLG